jgi:hypothetical protein
LASRSKGQTSPLRPDRECVNLTVEQEAWRLGFGASPTDRMEAGERWPSWETFDRICKLFGVVRGRRFMSSHLREYSCLKKGSA